MQTQTIHTLPTIGDTASADASGVDGRNGRPAAVGDTYILDDVLILEHFTEDDPVVVRLAEGAEDLNTVVHTCLQVGARAISLAEANLDAAVVERSFDTMVERLGQQLADTATSVHDTTHALLDADDGALTAALTSWRTDVENALGEAFDEDSKTSVIGKLDRVLEQAREAQVEAMRRLIDPHDEDGPLARQRREILKAVKEESAAIKTAVADVSEKIAVRRAEAELLERTAIKGIAFEDLVHAHVAAIVEPLGDIAEQSGVTAGASGSKKGDEVVTLNPEDVRGQGARYVLEAKDRKLGLSAILTELDDAQTNRQALASIAVFSSTSNCPSVGPFTYHGMRALVVLDKEDPDPGPLHLACLWARWAVRRQLAEQHDGVDVDRVEALIAEASRSLDRLATIRRCHTTARNKIQEASEQVGDLVGEVTDVLARLREEIDQ
jgi:hypothetical protein